MSESWREAAIRLAIAMDVLDQPNVQISEAEPIFEYFVHHGQYEGIEEIEMGVAYYHTALQKLKLLDNADDVLELLMRTATAEDGDGQPHIDSPLLCSRYNVVQALMKGFLNAAWTKYFALPRAYSEPTFALLEAMGGRQALQPALMQRELDKRGIDLSGV